MSFDLVAWVKRRGIEHIERGPNVARGHINIRCPFCRDDPSHHLGIELATGAWGCWRDSRHRGKSPKWLVMNLARCSAQDAEKIVSEGKDFLQAGLSSLDEQLVALDRRVAKKRPTKLAWPEECREISVGSRCFDYLARRGFAEAEIEKLADHYGLRYASTGEWKQRLLIPISYNGEMIGWTGRAVGSAEIRYKTHPGGDFIKRFLLNYDAPGATGGTLVVVEGPLDCLKLDWYGKRHGITAVALMGASWTAAQIGKLVKLSGRFKRTCLLLDPDALGQSLDLTARLSLIKAKPLSLPAGIEDPGAMTQRQVEELALSLS